MKLEVMFIKLIFRIERIAAVMTGVVVAVGEVKGLQVIYDMIATNKIFVTNVTRKASIGTGARSNVLVQLLAPSHTCNI